MTEAGWNEKVEAGELVPGDKVPDRVANTGIIAATDVSKFIRFALIGAMTAAIYFVLSELFQDVLGWHLMWASATAFTLAVVFQYVGHGAFTFGRRLREVAQIIRFSITVGIGLVLSILLVALGEQWQVAREVVLLTVMIVATLTNWLVFRWWVFVSEDTGNRGARDQ